MKKMMNLLVLSSVLMASQAMGIGYSLQQCIGFPKFVPGSTNQMTMLKWNPTNQFQQGGHCQTEEAMTNCPSGKADWSADGGYFECKKPAAIAAPATGCGAFNSARCIVSNQFWSNKSLTDSTQQVYGSVTADNCDARCENAKRNYGPATVDAGTSYANGQPIVWNK